MEINPNLSQKAKDDLPLVQRAQAGDQQAFATLHSKYHNTIYYLILKMVNNPSDAEDLAIEALGKAFRNIHQYVPRYAFSSWLFRIATNNCIDFIRKKRMNIVDYDIAATLQNETPSINNTLIAHQPDPEEVLISAQNISRIRKIIMSLPPKYQRLVTLRYLKEYTYEEISIELDLPMGTVKAQLFRAREILQELLADRENFF